MRLVLLAAAALAIASTASAQPAAPLPLRGVVTQIDAGHITVRPKAGKPVTVDLTPDWTVQVTKPIAVTEIKEGSFIGTSEIPQADGSGKSLEVHVFPPGVKIGEGHYAWNLRKGSMMTNGTVGKVTVGAKGRELQVSYPTGQRKIVVPPKVPVVQITGGTRPLVKKGVLVFLLAFPKPGAAGSLITGAVAVGENGAAPPM
ncbi:MAG: hypothetical protein KKE02_00480 [Alphaproteobacteria bacterium]|nr:hypothetical protein [Alphaproteobacteria bacterium]MBU1514691.1 hypothetical protein [Alphaproteobacteria bacterium]MBU2093550.1 hypothetical protein [Alphaproteobacteria bacterium]MBU2149464.1 hypothetical protein [Alphaproteobacteria bacterium]MBU2305493.1 hypothetical protein [Alphaproteobacteria bacterium]